MNKVAIVTSGYLPVPATKGGGVEVLDEYLIKENELEKKLNMTIYSSYDDEAAKQSKQFKHTKIEFIKTPSIFKLMDKGTYWFAKNILKKVKPNSYRYIFQRLHFLNSVSKKLSIEDFDKVVLENHATLFSVIKKHKNYDKYKGKYYFHLHNEVTNDFGNAYYIENCTKVLGVSNYINSTLKKRFPNMKEEQFTVLRNAVDHERFALELTETEKNLIRKQYGISKEDVVFLFSGRLTEEKGIVEALKAFKLANLDNAKFLVVGSSFFATDVKSQFEIQLESLIKEMGNQVIFTGFIPNNQMGKIYSIADVSVLPSIWDDPAPLTIIESITAGKAIITTNSGGIPEYVTENNAIVIERNDKITKKILNSILCMCENASLRELMSQESIKIAKNYSTRKLYYNFCDLLIKNSK